MCAILFHDSFKCLFIWEEYIFLKLPLVAFFTKVFSELTASQKARQTDN